MQEGMSPSDHLALLILVVIYGTVSLVLTAAFFIGLLSAAVYLTEGHLPAWVQQGLSAVGL